MVYIDFPDRLDDEWMHHTLSWWDEDNKGKKSVKLGTRGVHMQPLNDEMFHIPPKVSTKKTTSIQIVLCMK